MPFAIQSASFGHIIRAYSTGMSVTRVTVISIISITVIPSVMPNSYPRDGIFNPHLITIKDSYILC